MMKRDYLVVIGAMVLAVVLLTAGIWIGEESQIKREKMERWNAMLSELASHGGYENLGVVDGYAVSKRNGCLYSEEAIDAELAKRAGCELKNAWKFVIDSQDGMELVRLTVFSEEPTSRPIKDLKVERNYLYGLF